MVCSAAGPNTSLRRHSTWLLKLLLTHARCERERRMLPKPGNDFAGTNFNCYPSANGIRCGNGDVEHHLTSRRQRHSGAARRQAVHAERHLPSLGTASPKWSSRTSPPEQTPPLDPPENTTVEAYGTPEKQSRTSHAPWTRGQPMFLDERTRECNIIRHNHRAHTAIGRGVIPAKFVFLNLVDG